MLTRFLIGILLLFPASLHVAAQETASEPAAMDAAPLEDPVADDLTVPEDEGYTVPTKTLTDLLESARVLEAEGGPFDPQLGEQLASLGLAYQQNGQHAEAVETLERAMHIKRVNDGLHDLGQLPLVQELIESRIATESWDDLDRTYQLLLWIHRRNYKADDARFLPIVEQMGRWKLQAYKENLLEQSPEATLREADELFGDTIDLLEDLYGETDPRLVDSLYGKALTNYAVMTAEARKPLSDFTSGAEIGVPRVTYQTVCSQIVMPGGGARTVCRNVPMAGMGVPQAVAQQRQKELNIQQRLYAAKRTLAQIVEVHDAHPELGVESHAYALVHMGDWHTLAGQRGTAADNYRRAYQILSEAGNTELLKKLFGAPASVPSLRLQVEAVEEQLDKSDPAVVTVMFDVSKGGRTSRVEVVETTEPENLLATKRAKQFVKDATFRPRFENGEPVDTTGMKVNIPIRVLDS